MKKTILFFMLLSMPLSAHAMFSFEGVYLFICNFFNNITLDEAKILDDEIGDDTNISSSYYSTDLLSYEEETSNDKIVNDADLSSPYYTADVSSNEDIKKIKKPKKKVLRKKAIKKTSEKIVDQTSDDFCGFTCFQEKKPRKMKKFSSVKINEKMLLSAFYGGENDYL